MYTNALISWPNKGIVKGFIAIQVGINIPTLVICPINTDTTKTYINGTNVDSKIFQDAYASNSSIHFLNKFLSISINKLEKFYNYFLKYINK